MEKLGAPGTEAEGQFLPETYRFIGGTTRLELLRQAHAALGRSWTQPGRIATPMCRCTAPMSC